MDLRPAGLACERFSTAGLPLRSQFDAWRAYSDAWTEVAAPADREAGFQAEQASWHFGPFALSHCRAAAAEGGRDLRRLRGDQLDHLAILIWRRGEVEGHSGERGFRIAAPGVPHLFSLAVPGAWRRGGSEWVTLFLARDAVPDLAGRFDAACGRPLDAPLGRLLAAHLAALAEQAPSLTAEEAGRAAQATLALIRAAVGGSAEGLEAACAPAERALRGQLLALIRRHLDSSRLDPARLCRLAGLSRTRLYRLLEPEGGVARAILAERLRAARAALADPADRRPVGRIAEGFGMPDPSVFSRAFRREFGVSPSEFRAEALAGGARPWPGGRLRAGAATSGLAGLLRRLRA